MYFFGILLLLGGCLWDYSRVSESCLIYEDYKDENRESSYSYELRNDGIPIPDEYQYFSYAGKGGPWQTNYCPIFDVFDGMDCMDSSSTHDHSTADIIETFGNANARCVQSVYDEISDGMCFNVYCESFNYNTNVKYFYYTSYNLHCLNMNRNGIKC